MLEKSMYDNTNNCELLFSEEEVAVFVNKLNEYIEKQEYENLENLLQQDGKTYRHENYINNIINKLMNDDVTGKLKKEMLKLLKKSHLVKKVSDKKGTIMIKTNEDDFDILLDKLSTKIPELNEDNNLGDSKKRRGQCHTMSMTLSATLATPNELVTGYIFGVTDKIKNLHSWVEFNNNGSDYVIDYTQNVIINKEAYYYLRRVEVISKIKSSDVRKDIENFPDFIGGLNIKQYLTFRDEIIGCLEDNKDLFKNKEKTR